MLKIPSKIPSKKNMAHIKKIKRKKGNAYKAEVRLRGHQYTSKTFNKLTEAREWAKRTEMRLKLSQYDETESPKGDRMSVLANEIEQLKKEIQQIKANFQQSN